MTIYTTNSIIISILCFVTIWDICAIVTWVWSVLAFLTCREFGTRDQSSRFISLSFYESFISFIAIGYCLTLDIAKFVYFTIKRTVFIEFTFWDIFAFSIWSWSVLGFLACWEFSTRDQSSSFLRLFALESLISWITFRNCYTINKAILINFSIWWCIFAVSCCTLWDFRANEG